MHPDSDSRTSRPRLAEKEVPTIRESRSPCTRVAVSVHASRGLGARELGLGARVNVSPSGDAQRAPVLAQLADGAVAAPGALRRMAESALVVGRLGVDGWLRVSG